MKIFSELWKAVDWKSLALALGTTLLLVVLLLKFGGAYDAEEVERRMSERIDTLPKELKSLQDNWASETQEIQKRINLLSDYLEHLPVKYGDLGK